MAINFAPNEGSWPIDADEALRFRKLPKLSELEAGTNQIRHVVRMVETDWSSLPEDVRASLTKLAYFVIEPRLGPVERIKNVCSAAPELYRVVKAIAAGRLADVAKYSGAIRDYLDALGNLANAVLEVVETDHPEYAARLRNSKERAIASRGRGKMMTPEQYREWISSIPTRNKR